MERLKSMKDCLMSAVQGQMSHLNDVDTKELGEAVDMIKDLSEAIYYCTITEAMEGKDKHERYYTEPKVYPDYYPDYRDMDRHKGRMYYDGNSGYNGGHGSTGHGNGHVPVEMRDVREGRSPRSRKMYMESKEMHHDKTVHLKELEKYMQELTQDIVEMIEDASVEEKQYLEKRIAALGTKIGQLNG